MQFYPKGDKKSVAFQEEIVTITADYFEGVSMQKLLTMLRLQQFLNDTTNGEGWEKGVTAQGKRIDWRRCAFLEAAELIDSYPWKHWKDIDAAPDRENIRIEAVDIWHFVASEALRHAALEAKIDIEALAAMIAQSKGYRAFAAGETVQLESFYDEIAVVEDFVAALFCRQNEIVALCERFFHMASVCGLHLDSLYALYIGKNILNRFRQDHGYKEGSYIKLWNGEEDNVVMQRILQEQPDITPEALYEALKECYPG